MRSAIFTTTALVLSACLLPGAAQAGADKPIMAPAPAWVKPVALPPAPAKSDEAPIKVLLSDQQSRLEAGRITTYVNFAIKIQTPQGLAAGNLSFPWNPETDELSVHKLLIHRDGTVIDVLAGGQTFTVVRREPNLESATLDGVLTANIQPEGLQVGDILEYAITETSSDPVLKGHVEQAGGNWNGLPFARAHLSVQWPSNIPVTIRQTGALPPLKPVKSGAMTGIDLSLDNVEPVIPPRQAPQRYLMGRAVEFSDFKSWADLGALMAPLYAEAAKIPAEGPLRIELEKIKAASTDPVRRTEAALALVQDRVRYVALLMGVGGLTPAKAEETWARRYGDCKAKTALLLALLAELGIEAEPVAANAYSGDGLDKRLPMVGLFNHVLVRAHVGGQSYWLDGTRSGDTSLARLRTPDFGWGLPLVAQNAALVRMLPAPLDRPDDDLTIEIDARAGLTAPGPFKAVRILRGDSAIGTKLSLGGMTADARDRALRDYWREQFDFIEPARVEAVYDAATGEEKLTVEGTATLEWDNGWFQTNHTRIGYAADFVRAPGPDQDAPFVNSYPGYARTVETIQLPRGFAESKEIADAAVNETIAGTEYRRQASLVDNVYRIERTVRDIAPEFAASEAPAAQKRLRELDKGVFIRRPDNYRLTETELAAMLKSEPKTANAFVDRGNQLLARNRLGEAIADFDKAIALEPNHVMALADRGVAYAWRDDAEAAKRDLDKAAALDPRSKVVFHGRGILAQRRGDQKAAIEAYTQAIAIDPANEFALAQRSALYFATGDLDAALADLDRRIALDPKALVMRADRANLLRRQNREAEGLAEARAIEAMDPDNMVSHVMAGQIYAAFDKTDEALAAYDRALKLKPEAFIYISRAQARPKSDRTGRLADYDAALALAPTMPEAVAGKAGLQIDAGNRPAALKTYSDALAKSPYNVQLLSGRGVVYAKGGDMKRAQADFSAARAEADSAMALNSICWDKAIAGVALESALADCDASLAKEPGSVATLDSRALVLLRLGRLDEAISAYDSALAKSAGQSTSLYGRAIARSRKGDKEKAQTDREAALRIDPDVQKEFEGYGVTL